MSKLDGSLSGDNLCPVQRTLRLLVVRRVRRIIVMISPAPSWLSADSLRRGCTYTLGKFEGGVKGLSPPWLNLAPQQSNIRDVNERPLQELTVALCLVAKLRAEIYTDGDIRRVERQETGAVHSCCATSVLLLDWPN